MSSLYHYQLLQKSMLCHIAETNAIYMWLPEKLYNWETYETCYFISGEIFSLEHYVLSVW